MEFHLVKNILRLGTGDRAASPSGSLSNMSSSSKPMTQPATNQISASFDGPSDAFGALSPQSAFNQAPATTSNLPPTQPAAATNMSVSNFVY